MREEKASIILQHRRSYTKGKESQRACLTISSAPSNANGCHPRMRSPPLTTTPAHHANGHPSCHTTLTIAGLRPTMPTLLPRQVVDGFVAGLTSGNLCCAAPSRRREQSRSSPPVRSPVGRHHPPAKPSAPPAKSTLPHLRHASPAHHYLTPTYTSPHRNATIIYAPSPPHHPPILLTRAYSVYRLCHLACTLQIATSRLQIPSHSAYKSHCIRPLQIVVLATNPNHHGPRAGRASHHRSRIIVSHSHSHSSIHLSLSLSSSLFVASTAPPVW